MGDVAVHHPRISVDVTATLFVATENGTTVTEAYQNNLFSTDRANSYATLATSEQVAARAVDQLKGSITPEELRVEDLCGGCPKDGAVQR